MLTRKQHELLEFIQAYIAEFGYAPSFDEMKAAIMLRSKSGVHRLIVGLEQRGFIRRLRHQARALEIIPQDAPTDTMLLAGEKAILTFKARQIRPRAGEVAMRVYEAMQKARAIS